MSYPSQFMVAIDTARGWSSFVKYGHNSGVSVDYTPVNTGGFLQLPTPSGASALQAVSTSDEDQQGGAGAYVLALSGLDANGEDISDLIPLTGTTPTALTTNEYWRLQFADVVSSGTYADQNTGSHVGNITITDGVNSWALIDSNGYPHSRWQSSWYTVPKGKSAFISKIFVSDDGNKLYDLKLLARTGADVELAPFSAMMELLELTGIEGSVELGVDEPVGPLPEFSDIGFIARTESGGGGADAHVSATVSIIVKDGQ